jgi:hypothetical protein
LAEFLQDDTTCDSVVCELSNRAAAVVNWEDPDAETLAVALARPPPTLSAAAAHRSALRGALPLHALLSMPVPLQRMAVATHIERDSATGMRTLVLSAHAVCALTCNSDELAVLEDALRCAASSIDCVAQPVDLIDERSNVARHAAVAEQAMDLAGAVVRALPNLRGLWLSGLLRLPTPHSTAPAWPTLLRCTTSLKSLHLPADACSAMRGVNGLLPQWTRSLRSLKVVSPFPTDTPVEAVCALTAACAALTRVELLCQATLQHACALILALPPALQDLVLALRLKQPQDAMHAPDTQQALPSADEAPSLCVQHLAQLSGLTRLALEGVAFWMCTGMCESALRGLPVLDAPGHVMRTPLQPRLASVLRRVHLTALHDEQAVLAALRPLAQLTCLTALLVSSLRPVQLPDTGCFAAVPDDSCATRLVELSVAVSGDMVASISLKALTVMTRLELCPHCTLGATDGRPARDGDAAAWLALAAQLAALPALHTLELGQIGYGEHRVAAGTGSVCPWHFAAAACTPHTRRLHVHDFGCCCTPVQGRLALSTNALSSLEELSLHRSSKVFSCQVTLSHDRHVQSTLSAVLRAPTSLRSLCLKNRELYSIGLSALAQAVPQLTALTSLRLRLAMTANRWLAAVIGGFQAMPYLKCVDLTFLTPAPNLVAMLAQSLPSLLSLTELSLTLVDADIDMATLRGALVRVCSANLWSMFWHVCSF